MDPRGNRSQVMREGVRARVGRLAHDAGQRARRWSSPTLLGLLCAGALAPWAVAGFGGAALVTTGISAVTSIGGNVLTDLAKAGVRRLGQDGGTPSLEDVEAELEQRIQQALEAGGDRAEQLRGEIAEVLREVDAVGAALEAALQSGNHDLLEQLTTGFAETARQFDEFGFLLTAVQGELRLIRDRVDEQSGQLRLAIDLQYQQATRTRELLDQVSAIEVRTRPDGSPEGGRAEGTAGEESPYRGLVPFSETDAHVFFGRERVTAQLTSTVSQRLTAGGLVVVTGASGAGKSSLLRAGLLPAIGRGELSEAARDWPRLVLEAPTRSPLERLASLLAPLAGLEAPAVLRSLRSEPEQAHLLVRQAVDHDVRRKGLPAEAAGASRLVLVVDQFEEVFNLPSEQEHTGADDTAAFISALNAAATLPCGPQDAPAAMVVIAVRGDFVDRCAAYPGLASAVQDGLFVVGPMTESELRLTITAPAAAAGLDLEEGLTDTILSEVRSPSGGYEAGVLPLVSQTMLTVWTHLEDHHRLTLRGYGLTGGVSNAVASSVDDAYDDLSSDTRERVRQVFLHLAGVTPSGQLVRRTAARADLYAGCDSAQSDQVDQVLDAFARQRLIVVDADTVQISHDVLLDAWSELRAWLEPDVTGRALYGQLRDAAEEWNGNERAASYLYRGKRLAAVEDSRKRWEADPETYPPLTPTQAAFLTASTTAESRSTRIRRTAVATLAGLLTVAVIAATLAIIAQSNADRQRDIAISDQLATQSETLGNTDPTLARLESLAAWRIAPTAQARHAMLTTATLAGIAALPGNTGAEAVAFSPDGRALVAAGGNGVTRWNATTHQQIANYPTGNTDLKTVAFSPDGRTLATGGQFGGAVQLWDVATRREIGDGLTGSTVGAVNAVAFSPDGKTVATGGGDGMARLWNVATQQQVGLPLTNPSDVLGLAFSPDGKTLATGSMNGTTRLWNVATHRQIGQPLANPNTGSPNPVNAVAFSPDGRMLVTGGQDARLWDVATQKQLGQPFAGNVESVKAVAFSPDGRMLVTGGRDARLWDVATQRQLGQPLTDNTGDVLGVAFSPDGKTLATGSGNGPTRLWNVGLATNQQAGKSLTTIKGNNDSVQAVAFGLDGRMVATGSSVGPVRLWDTATHQEIGQPLPNTDAVKAVAFSPDGRTLATGGDEGPVRLWDAATHQEIGQPLAGDTEFVNAVAFSPGGRTLATGGDDHTVRLWDVTTHQQIGGSLTANTGSVKAVAFGPDGKTLATGGEDGTVRLWNVDTHRQISRPFPHSDVAVAFSPDGRTLATADLSGGTAQLWNVATHQQIGQPLTGNTGSVNAVVFSPDGKALVTGGGDGTARLWSVDTDQQIGQPLTTTVSSGSNSVNAVAFSPNGETLVTGGDDGAARLWNVNYLADPSSWLCSQVQRSLTPAEWAKYVPAGPAYRRVCP